MSEDSLEIDAGLVDSVAEGLVSTFDPAGNESPQHEYV